LQTRGLAVPVVEGVTQFPSSGNGSTAFPTGSRVDVPHSVEAALRNVQAVHMELERLIVDVARSKRLR